MIGSVTVHRMSDTKLWNEFKYLMFKYLLTLNHTHMHSILKLKTVFLPSVMDIFGKFPVMLLI